MKKLLVFRKLSFQLIVATTISFFVSMVAFLVLEKNLVMHSMNNEANVNLFFFYITLSIAFIVPILIFMIIFLLLVRKKVGYIKYISEQVNKITEDDLGLTLEVVGNDEIAGLCENINYMSREIKGSFEHKIHIENENSEMIAKISHDLRAPITTITEYLYILKNKKYESKEEEHEYLSGSYNMSIKLKKLISELFEYTKFSSKDLKLKLKEIDLGFMLIKILEEYTPRFEESGLKIKLDIEEEILVNVDYEKITSAFNHILCDVVKYSGLLSNLIIKVENKSGTAHISIVNIGKDLEGDKLNAVFGSFNKIDFSKSKEIRGKEFRLDISKKVIELHNGVIWIESDENVKTIQIKLPISHRDI